MTVDTAGEITGVQVARAGGYNRSSARLILWQGEREQDQGAVEKMDRGPDLGRLFGLEPGVRLTLYQDQ